MLEKYFQKFWKYFQNFGPKEGPGWGGIRGWVGFSCMDITRNGKFRAY